MLHLEVVVEIYILKLGGMRNEDPQLLFLHPPGPIQHDTEIVSLAVYLKPEHFYP